MARRDDPATPAARPTGRLQRVLATMAATVIGLTVLAIAAIFVLRAAGVSEDAFRSGPLQLLAVLPTPGLAVGLLLVIALVVAGVLNRDRRAG